MRRDQESAPEAEEIERLLAERGNWLMGIAIALTGKRADAEDLLQAALERLLRSRRGVIVDTEAYLRRDSARRSAGSARPPAERRRARTGITRC